jgi:hypothetical protein
MMESREPIYETPLIYSLREGNEYLRKRHFQDMRYGDNQLTYASLFTIHDVQNANHTRYSPVKSYI